MKNDETIEKLTKLNLESQNQRLRFLAKVDVCIKLEIMQDQKQLFHKMKSQNKEIENTVLTYISLLLAIDKFLDENDGVNLRAIKLRGSNHSKKVKREKLLGYWAIVRTLKLEQNMSYREISKYFAKYHKFEVSYSTIYELWNELENNINEMENRNGK